MPIFLIANELFDALPIRQFEIASGALCERVVGLKDGALVLGLSPAVTDEVLPDHAEDGTVIETCPAGRNIAAELGIRLKLDGGAALVIDYGHDTAAPRGDTLQAVKDHALYRYSRRAGTGRPDGACRLSHAGKDRRGRGAQRPGASGLRVRSSIGSAFASAPRCLRKLRPSAKLKLRRRSTASLNLTRWGTLFKALALSGDEIDPPGFSQELGA